MKKRTSYLQQFKTPLLMGMLAGLLFMQGLATRAQPVQQDITLTAICNSRGAPAEMKMSELKSVLMGEKQRWSDGTKVVIAMVKSTTPLGEIISKRIYSMSGDGVRGFWAGISFAGKYDPPNVFNTVTELETFVAQNPGAIAILDKPIGNDVRVISIDGKKSF